MGRYERTAYPTWVLRIDDLTWAGKLMAYAALGSSQAHLEELVAWYYRSPEGSFGLACLLKRSGH